MSWLNSILAPLYQTQTCKQVSPILASLMSHEPTDTVNNPCEAQQSLNLPLGHHSKRPRSCRLSRNRIIVPVTAQVPRLFPGSRSKPCCLGYTQTHVDGGTHPHIHPCQSTVSVSNLPFFVQVFLHCDYDSTDSGHSLIRLLSWCC